MTESQIRDLKFCKLFVWLIIYAGVWLIIYAGAYKCGTDFSRDERIEQMKRRIETLEAAAGQPDASLGPVIRIMPRPRPAGEQLL